MPKDETVEPVLVQRSTTQISPWVSLDSVTTTLPGATEPSVYHGIRQADYIQVLCQHENGSVVLVRQFRPIVEQWTLEFPGGLRDGDEPPSAAARREVEEETGLSVIELISLVETFADVGRLTNRCYGFFAIVGGRPASLEAGVDPRLVSGADIRQRAAAGDLSVPGHTALLYLAAINAEVKAACSQHGVTFAPWMD